MIWPNRVSTRLSSPERPCATQTAPAPTEMPVGVRPSKGITRRPPASTRVDLREVPVVDVADPDEAHASRRSALAEPRPGSHALPRAWPRRQRRRSSADGTDCRCLATPGGRPPSRGRRRPRPLRPIAKARLSGRRVSWRSRSARPPSDSSWLRIDRSSSLSVGPDRSRAARREPGVRAGTPRAPRPAGPTGTARASAGRGNRSCRMLSDEALELGTRPGRRPCASSASILASVAASRSSSSRAISVWANPS